MKRLLVLLVFCSVFFASFSQTIRTEREKEMAYAFDSREFYKVLAKTGEYFREYPLANMQPDKDWIRVIRIYTWIMLHDKQNLVNELNQTLAVNPRVVDQLKMHFLVDKKLLAEQAVSGYMTDPVLDPGRDYRPEITYCDTVRGGPGPARACFDVTFYDLSLSILPETREISGRNRIYFIMTEPSDVIQIDLFDHYNIEAITMGGTNLEYRRDCHAIMLKLPGIVEPGEKSCIEVVYSGTPHEAVNPPWNGGFVWKTFKGKHWAGVACEHLGASSWWPVKDHLSDKPDSMRITLTVPAGYQALSNGNLRSVVNNPDETGTFEWFVSYPINSYNVTFYLGDFVNFNEMLRGKECDFQVDYYVLKKNLKKGRKYYAQTARIMEVFGELFGDYPFPRDGGGFVEAPFRGMEHQGAIAIGSDYNTEHRLYTIPGYSNLLVHETAHEWWGNAVAIGDMADAWINEGFATYSEYLFTEQLIGHVEYIDAVGKNNQVIVNAWPMVGDRDVNDNTFVTGDIYFKGAAMLHNLRCILDDDSLFLGLIRGIYEEFSMKITSTGEVLAFIRDYCRTDLESFFEVFLYEADPPELEYDFHIDGGKFTFNYRWTGVKENFCMPFCIMLNGAQCVRLVGTTDVQTYRRENTHAFYIPTPFYFDASVISPNAFTYFYTHYVH